MCSTVQNEQQNTCRDGDLSRLENPKLLPVALNPSVLFLAKKPRIIKFSLSQSLLHNTTRFVIMLTIAEMAFLRQGFDVCKSFLQT
ncbi:hypothetical protein [Nostoc sp.]|uniref:hypothetical protein n=1 Tax=Nostoc sp. TaxID=1180 RepID=UPI002FFA1DF4